MKVKILALVAAFFMLMGGSAWAQANVKGDVNGDGVVNEQDIAAILAIMQEAGGVKEQTKYYWYAGQEMPTSLTTDPTPNNKFICNNWFEIGSTLPTSISEMVTGGVRGLPWFAAFPTAAGLVAGSSADPDTSIVKINTILVNGISYDVWEAGGVTAIRFNVDFNK